MEKITFNKRLRPKSAKIGKYALTETNINHNHSNNQSNYNFPNIRDRLEQKYFYKDILKTRNTPVNTHRRFFLSSTPFNFFRSKDNKNEFFVCYNGGPIKKFSLGKKKLSLNMSKIHDFTCKKKYRLKGYKCPTTKNEKEKIKYNSLYNSLEEEKNNQGNDKYLKTFINQHKKTYKLKLPDETEKDEDIVNENKEEKKDEEKNEKNYFRIIEKPRLNFRKIQIHNNCKPFLVDDYRYYAEKYL